MRVGGSFCSHFDIGHGLGERVREPVQELAFIEINKSIFDVLVDVCLDRVEG